MVNLLKLKVPGWLPRKLYYMILAPKDNADYGTDDCKVEVIDPKQAVVASSEIFKSDMHAPVLDLDCKHTYVPSTNAGHGHLYLDVPMTWDDYKELLTVLAKVGVIEKGYADASKNKGYSAVRLPWIKKGDDTTLPPHTVYTDTLKGKEPIFLVFDTPVKK